MPNVLLQTVWLVPFYGLLGAIASLPWATGAIRKTGSRPAAYINLLLTLLAFIHGAVVFRLTWDADPQQLLFHWFQTPGLDLTFALEISHISMGAMEVVTGLSLVAQLYALGYMEKDWSLARFYGLMGFFEAAISGLALSDSLFLSYALLEMLTLSTYLLVGFWYAQPLVVTAARDAFLTKRVGDVLLLMGVVALSFLAGGLNFSDLELWAQNAQLPPITATLLGLALIAGPTGKCAQFPLHLWLDEAMEGPNPASILRNSIVVASGAYILIKLQPVLALSPIASDTLIVLGTCTAIGASLVAIAQIDIKRALSHSTSAYLGLVFVAVGLQQVDIALLLLFTHAIAKALLFMSIGSVILTTNTQDLTELGGLGSRMPATALSFVVGAAGTVALLPLGSFWAMRRWVDGFWLVPAWLVVVLCLVNALTAFNLTRVFCLVFSGPVKPKTRRAPEVAWPMAVPLVAMIIVNLLVPLMLQHWQLLLSWSGPWATPDRALNEISLLPLVLSAFSGCLVAALIYFYGSWKGIVNQVARPLHDLFAYDFYIDRLYRLTVVFFVEQLSRLTTWFDRYVVDGVVNFVGFASIFGGESLKYNASGQSQFYLLTILLGIGLLGLILNWSILSNWPSLVEWWSSLP